MKIILPFPPSKLAPNGTRNRHERARLTKSYRIRCGWEAKATQGGPFEPDTTLPVRITFYPPDKRRRDRDNMIGAFKAGQDGVADAIGVDDYFWEPTYARGEPFKGGKVVLEIG